MLTNLQIAKFSQQFQLLDTNKNGVLAWDDFQGLLNRLAQARAWSSDSPRTARAEKCHRGLWEALISHSSANEESGVTLEQWLTFHQSALEEQVLLTINPAYEALAVSMTNFIQDSLDADGDGNVTAKEYSEFCQAYDIDEVQARACFQKLDRNSDEQLTRAEIMDLVLEYYCSDDPEAPGNLFFGNLGSQSSV